MRETKARAAGRCERSIRTLETAPPFTLDLNALPVIKKLCHLPVMVDPRHGTGHWEYVAAIADGGIACGADALSDSIQSLKPALFQQLLR